MIHNYVITGFTCLLAGFILGWLACETRVWRQIKKHAQQVNSCPCCGAPRSVTRYMIEQEGCPGCGFPNCGHAHNVVMRNGGMDKALNTVGTVPGAANPFVERSDRDAAMDFLSERKRH